MRPGCVNLQTATDVSVVMANYNAAPYIQDAIKSALSQTLKSLEVLVADDASIDDSVVRVKAIAARDPRVRLIVARENAGAGAARNRALAVARGKWIAVLDSDDLMHPERLAFLIDAAERDGADIVADDLLIFDDDRTKPISTLLKGDWARAPFDVRTVDYIRSNCIYGHLPVLGYLKPIFRASVFRASGIRYSESLRIAEDFDLVLRLLVRKRRFRVFPEPMYFYRKRSSSTSHRLSAATISAIHEGDATLRADNPDLPREVSAELDERLANVSRALAFDNLVGSLKRKSFATAALTIARRPSCVRLLALPVIARLRRLSHCVSKGWSIEQDGKNIAVVSRRMIDPQGNSLLTTELTYLQELKSAGLRLHYICPTPGVVGSLLFRRIPEEMSVFDTISIQGAMQVGRSMLIIDPRMMPQLLKRAIRLVAPRKRRAVRASGECASDGISLHLSREDVVYLSNCMRGRADGLVFDEAALAPTGVFAMRPDSGAVVVALDHGGKPHTGNLHSGTAGPAARADEGLSLPQLGRS